MATEFRRIGKHRDKWVAVVSVDGVRQRWSLGNLDATPENRPAAERAAEGLKRQLAAPAGNTCADIYDAYLKDRSSSEKVLVDKDRIENAWKALKPHFANLRAEQVTREMCRAYIASRRALGRKDGTIRKELTVLRAALQWADKNTPAVLELPAPPPPKERWLTRKEFLALLEAAKDTYHLTVFLHLAIATAGRKEALLEMTWMQVRWERNEIWLGRKANGKARATVQMTKRLRSVLEQAKKVAITDYVIEFNGERVKSVRTAFEHAVDRAKLKDVTPHTLRHTAAVWMAGNGVPMEKIAQFLGHSDSRITERVYARFQPEHFTDALEALEV